MAEPAAGEDPAMSAADQRRDSEASAPASPPAVKKKKDGVLSRIWRGVFGSRNEDYGKRLQHLSNEEAAVHSRIKRRAVRSRKMSRNIIVLSLIVEVMAIAYAFITLRSLDLSWKMKSVQSLPAILSPGLFLAIYTAVVRLTRMFDRKDQKTLERLRAETKAKLDELKESTNFYNIQELIQRYDLDPAAKAAAASVLASKLGTDSGLKLFLGDGPSAKSNDVELVQSSGLRNRKRSLSRNNSNVSIGSPQSMSEVPNEITAAQNQMVVEHHRGPSPSDGGWIGRLAALLVGEDPSHSYALICGNCLRHNGLARKEDFPHITYYCPHCHALNTSSEQLSSNLAQTQGSQALQLQ